MSSDSKNLLDFFRIIGKLKHLKRTGWVKRGVDEPETVAGHMYRMAMMTMVLPAGDQLDRTRALKMALVHDAAEAIVGDITPFCGVSAEEKRRREMAALSSMTELLDAGPALELTQLFDEYELNETAEARLVHDLDKLDMILQADEYESEGRAAELQEFFDSTRSVFRTQQVMPLVDELRAQRAARLASSDSNTARTDDQDSVETS